MPAFRAIWLLLMLSFAGMARGQDLHIRWATAFPGSTLGDLEGKAMARSPLGELYCTNNIGNEVRGEAFLNKIDSCGNEVWEIRWQPDMQGMAKLTSVVVAEQGELYVAGYFTGRLDFDPGPGTRYQEAGLRKPAGFVARYTPAGQLEWVRVIGDKSAPQFADGATGAAVYALSLTPTQQVLAAGNFSGTLDVALGSGTVRYSSGGAIGTPNACFFQLDPDGNSVLFEQLRSDSSGSLYSIATDPLGNIYVGGEFRSGTDFDPAPTREFVQAPEGNSDAFVGRYTAQGRFSWVKTMGTPFPELCNSLVVDANGNVYFKVIFAQRQNARIDVDPGPDVFLFNTDISNRGIVKYDAQGNFRWGKQYASNANSFFYPEYNPSLALLPGGQLLYVGSFSEFLDTDPGNTGVSLLSAGKQDVFLLTHSTEGDLLRAISYGGENNDGSNSVLASTNGDVYTSGYFNKEADFDPGPGIYPLNSDNRKYHFVQRLAPQQTLHYQSVRSCRPVTLFNTRYDSSGTYLLRLRGTRGCDSLVSLQVTIAPIETRVDTLLCAGDSLFAGGRWQRQPGTYTDVFQTAGGCDSTVVLTLAFRAAPAQRLGPDRAFCVGQETILDPGPYLAYTWQDQSTQRQFRVTDIGTYWVLALDSNRCVYRDTVRFTERRPPPGQFLPPVKQLCRGEALPLEVPGFSSYTWSNGSTQGTLTIREEGMVRLQVTDRYGCKGVDSIRIERDVNCIPVSIPNAFTPDGNGINDRFLPLLRQEAEQYLFRVYNRWGQRVFESRQPGEGWDGQWMGRLQSPGTYTYDFYMRNRLGDELRKKGIVTLIR